MNGCTKIKKPRAGFPDAGLVSLTMTCLRYLVMNTELLPSSPCCFPVTCHL
jgi:hypothetical protein